MAPNPSFATDVPCRYRINQHVSAVGIPLWDLTVFQWALANCLSAVS